MQKTRFGISVGLLGAGVFFLGLFSGYLVLAILAGYILLFEENEWLKKSAVKAISFMMLISFVTVILNLVPNTISFINNIVGILGGNFSIGILTKIISTMISALDIVEKVVLLGLGVKALNQGSISIPIIDKMISKYMG